VGIERFTDFEVWRIAHQAVVEIYRITKAFPSDERFGLIQQMRRSAVSVPANIAEGFGRRHPKDKVRFYNMSQASIEELRYYLILAGDLGYAKDLTGVGGLLDSTARMLKRLVLSISDSGDSSP
jgi:four helix bundle protein